MESQFSLWNEVIAFEGAVRMVTVQITHMQDMHLFVCSFHYYAEYLLHAVQLF